MIKIPRFALPAAAICAAALLSGCMPLFKTQKDVYDVEERHPIVVEPDSASMSVPVSNQAPGLAPQSERDVRAFLAVYKARGHGPITIARPVGSGNDKMARRVSEDILRLTAELGVDPVDVMPQTYTVSAGAPSSPVLLSFTRFVASVGPCGDWSHNYASTLRNTEMPNFGCATQNNIAAMMDDPHDLIAPRGMTASDAERRAVVIGKYRKGESTITERKEDEKTEISKVGGGQ
jgi:pilus assembly protein CpaD